MSTRNLAPDIRASLNAKLARLLARPIIARVVGSGDPGERDVADLPDMFRALQAAAREVGGSRADAWRADPDDGTCSVRIAIDYDKVWRGCEKEVRDTVSSAVESAVAFLTEEQRLLLEQSPREFLALSPRPETAELIAFETENVGGSARVVELRLAAAPASRKSVRHLAIVPNLVQIERQLEALHQVETATDEGPLGPLRALVGLCDAGQLQSSAERDADAPVAEHLDPHQRECLAKAMASPHFSVIEGPPGSGKTTVITSIVQRALARGERVLVVSPTHVAVDNVVEKLLSHTDGENDRLEARTLPLRYAARPAKLSPKSLEYWVGAKKQRRGASISRRVQARLTQTVPFAGALFAAVDEGASGNAPISSALALTASVICGTPIGVLSFDVLKNTEPASFGLLIVDEVSKMTIPEFLAVAVKARRWVVVGDPAQLPPYNDSEENATALDDIIPPLLELACSVGAVLERVKPHLRREERLVVVSSDPERSANAIRAHLGAVMADGIPSVGTAGDSGAGIVVCAVGGVEQACHSLARSNRGTEVRILVERGRDASAVPTGCRLVGPKARAQASIMENGFNVYHLQPWATRAGQRLASLGFRNGVEKYLPSVAAIAALTDGSVDNAEVAERRQALLEAIAVRFAVNTVSVYDWLTGMPVAEFDRSPLCDLMVLSTRPLFDAVRPFVGTLKNQYRMHSTISRVPRELFYFDEALFDGRGDERSGPRVTLVQVEPDREGGESNHREVEAIVGLIERLSADPSAKERRPGVMVITPYREQEASLAAAMEHLGARGAGLNVDVEVSTLDRCQGREAEYVLLSLVRSRATVFFDNPKRWNVALTRAKEGLFIVGNVDAYRREAAEARRELNGGFSSRNQRIRRGEQRPRMSLLARIIEAYSRHEDRP